MTSTSYLLIGGGLASCEAVKGIRKHDTTGTIVLVGDESRLPYNRPPLSKALLKGEKTPDECLCEDGAFYEDHHVELLTGHRVTALDGAHKEAVIDDGRTIAFEKALLATGGTPVRLPIAGMDKQGVHLLRTMEDSLAIREAAREANRAVVVGAGFIGMEISSSLAAMGLDVTVIELNDHLWPRFADPALADDIRDYYEGRGVRVLTGDTVDAIRGSRRAESVATGEGQDIACDLVVCAVGIRPNTDLAEQAGLACDNGVVVNAALQTGNSDIYAAGDIANVPDPYFDKRRRVEHWGQAEYTGGLAGENMAGADASYDLLTYAWSEGFDLNYEFAGEEGVYDDVIRRGRFPEDDFASIYLSEGLAHGFIAVNPAKDTLKALESLVHKRMDVSGIRNELADPETDLSALVEA